MNQTPQQTPHPKRIPIFIIKTLLFAVLAMLGLSFAALHFLSDNKGSLEERAISLIEQLANHKRDGEISMVLLGDSRSRYAWRLGDDPTRTTTLPDGRVLRSVKISFDNAAFSQFLPMTEALITTKPDLILLQQSMLLRQPAEKGKLSKIRDLPYLLAFKLLMFGDGGQREWTHQHAERVCTHNTSRFAFEQRLRTHFTSSPPDLTGQQARDLHNFIRNAQDAGIKVAIVRIPPNGKAVEKLGVKPIKLDNIYIDAMPTHDALAPNGLADTLDWLEFNIPEDKDVFCDFIHLDDSGSAAFAYWLKSEIARIIPGPTE